MSRLVLIGVITDKDYDTTSYYLSVVNEDKRKKINMVREVVKSALGYHMQSVPKDFPDYTSY